MDATWMAKQMIDFQKTAFDNTFSAVAMLQDHTEKVTNTLIEQVGLLPDEGRQALEQWREMVKQGRTDMKNAVDDNYDKLAEWLAVEK